MPDMVDRIRAELEARIRELRPVVRELERLEHAAAALARGGVRSVAGLRSRVGASSQPAATTRSRGAGAGTSRPRPSASASQRRRKPAAGSEATTRAPAAGRKPPRKAAPRGQTQARVLEALTAAPGSGAAAVAESAGISRNAAGATLSRLVRQGRVRRLAEGGYAIAEPPAQERPAASPAAGTEGSATAANGGEAPPPAGGPSVPGDSTSSQA